MLQNSYDFFVNEYKKYEQILLEYKNNKSKIFVDENFHPINKIAEHRLLIKSGIDLYDTSITWRRIDEVYHAKLFEDSKIHPLYVTQGSIGDCYFITALSRLAKHSSLVQTLFEKQLPDKILGEISDSVNIECGAVVVYFRVFGRRTPVLIDTLIPFRGQRPLFSSPINKHKSPWFCLVEKAFAKLNGCYSNIIGGLFSDSIYSLYGYYTKIFNFTSDNEKNSFKILKYQKYGCLMDASISKINDTNVQEANRHNLFEKHSYLLIKIRKYKGMVFYQLINPWGKEVWNGDYSIDSDLWTPELKKVLHNKPKNGSFWMIDKDFFTHYTRINVAKPVNPHWFMREFSIKLPPTKNFDINNLDKLQNFAIQLTEKIPEGKKARFRILVEKRNTNYEKLFLKGSYLTVLIGRNGGKKLKSYDFYNTSYNISSLSTKISGIDDIITFTIIHLTPEEIEADCYVNVFCEFDFKLYDIDHPNNIFSRGKSRGAVFDNFSISAPDSALILKNTIINGKEELWLKNPTISDFNKLKDAKKDNIIIKSLIDETKASHYYLHGTQIDLKKFIFNNDFIGQGNTSDVYSITEEESGEECVAIINRNEIEFVSKSFSKLVTIMRQLKYPSIINFIGFSETNFLKQPYPMIITEFLPKGTLSSLLPKLNNTQKMIILIGIAFGMNYIHKHNIIHRDLRCSSILLDHNMHPKISHFNLAQIAGHDLEFFGTNIHHLIAPELIEGPQPYSFSADVFAYGMIFYHIISNQEPTIKHTHEIDLYFKILGGDLPSLDNVIHPKYHNFIRSMWHKNPEQRPTFKNIIEKLLNERNEYWLDDVDEKEVERYIHQFGVSLKKKNQSEYIDIINQINEESLPTIPYEQILSDSSITKSTKDDIKRADELIANLHELPQNKDLFYRVGIELLKNLPQNIFNSVKYLKASALSEHHHAIINLAIILCINTSKDELIKIGVDLANIASDFNIKDAFILLGSIYKDGRGVKLNLVMSAINYKIAADLGEVNSMFQYATILMNFFTKTINDSIQKRMVTEAKEIINNLDGKNSYFYEEARHTFDTIENNEASLYVAKKYFEKASKKGSNESSVVLERINTNYNDIAFPPPYFEELYQDITDEMLNK